MKQEEKLVLRTKIRLAKFLSKGTTQHKIYDLNFLFFRENKELKIACSIVKGMIGEGIIIIKTDPFASLSDAGRLWLKRQITQGDAFREQHGKVVKKIIFDDNQDRVAAKIDIAESPLGWLNKRRDKTGRQLINNKQLQAGEKLRYDFSCAQLSPSITSNWAAYGTFLKKAKGHGSQQNFPSDKAFLARDRVQKTLKAVGPEFADLLVDICCFLKRLEYLENHNNWPARSGKIILQLALDRLVRYYETGE